VSGKHLRNANLANLCLRSKSAAASERLAKAREVKIEKNPNYGQEKHTRESCVILPDDHQLSPTKVKQWINVQQEYAKSERFAVRQNVKGAIARLARSRRLYSQYDIISSLW
jgi:hypothetical protein